MQHAARKHKWFTSLFQSLNYIVPKCEKMHFPLLLYIFCIFSMVPTHVLIIAYLWRTIRKTFFSILEITHVWFYKKKSKFIYIIYTCDS